MKVLWVGDAVASTGFARCTHAVCDRLYEHGHEVHVLGMNYWGGPHNSPYPILPCVDPTQGGHDPFGASRLPRLIKELKPDVVVILNDPWNIGGYDAQLREQLGLDYENKPLMVGWLAVDGKNQHSAKRLNAMLDRVVVWTDFAKDEMVTSGYEGPISVVPLGVDSERFFPVDRMDARDGLGLKEPYRSAFIFGVVGRNQPRKRLDLTIKYFARFVEQRPSANAYLYLHCAPTGDNGTDIVSVCKYYGIEKQVLLGTPDVGRGVPGEQMRLLYNSFNVYLTTSQGEGWGLPALEAMACDVPVVAPDWSGLGSWARDAAVLVPCSDTAMTAPLNSKAYTIGGVVDGDELVKTLVRFYDEDSSLSLGCAPGFALATRHTWNNTSELFIAALHRAVEHRTATREPIMEVRV